MSIQRPKTIVEQVSEIIGQRIQDKIYPPGSRIPSETELAEDLRVSRTTVRTALAKYAAEGLLVRKQGDGTYVSQQAGDFERRYGGQWDFSRVIESNGYTPSIIMVSREERQATAEEAQALSISADENIWDIDRIFLADNNPAIYVTNIVPVRHIRNKNDIPDGYIHIHHLLERYCSETVAYAMTDIEAALWEMIPKKFKAPSSSQPLLKLNEIFFNRDNMALALGTSFYDDSVLRLRLIRS
ncbi:MAG: GntR family transcriptional regulator [Anaerolineae bacterium]